MNTRIKEVRKNFHLSQREFGKRLGVTDVAISRIEKGERNLTEQMLLAISREFGVSEQWLRTGEGEMIIQSETFSLNDYAKKANLSALEFDIIRGYLELDEDVRRSLTAYLVSVVSKHSEIAATNEIEEDVANYRREREAEKTLRTLSALPGSKEA